MAFLVRHSSLLCINGLSTTATRSLHRPPSIISSKFVNNVSSQCKSAAGCSRALNQYLFSSQKSFFHTGLMSRARLLTGLKVQRVCFTRHMSKGSRPSDQRAKSMIIYISAVGIFMLGMSYAGVPLYRMFCQVAGLGGQATRGHDDGKVESMAAVKDRIIQVKFNADVASSMRWNFKPQQSEVKVIPGETALAFYTAKNPTDKPIIGISTYNVVPFEAGQYFNKIQCFCFEEQRLNPHEQVDMPVFFFIDPEYAEDPKLESVHTITLSYTFFEAKEGLQLPYPGYATS